MQRTAKILTAAFTAVVLTVAAMTVSSANDIKWEAPLNDISAWVGSTGDVALDSDECWLDAEVENGALVINENESCRVFYPYIKVKNTQEGLFDAVKGDKLNFTAELNTDESADNSQAHSFGLVLTFAAKNSEGNNIDVNVNEAIAESDGGIKISESGNLLAGNVNTSVDLADAVRKGTSKEDYEAIYGEDGDSTVIAVRAYISTGEYAPETKLTLRRLNITSADVTSGETNESSDSPVSVSSYSSTSSTSSVPQVDTGENVAPVFGITVLAAAAAFAVVITKSRTGKLN